MDLSLITTAAQSLNALRTAVSALSKLKVDVATLGQVNDALEKVSDVQAGLLSAQAQMFELQQENQRLTRLMAEADGWRSRLSSYELVRAPGGAIVYRSREQPAHYACPSCVETQTIRILQTNGNDAGIYECPACKIHLNVDAGRREDSCAGWRPEA